LELKACSTARGLGFFLIAQFRTICVTPPTSYADSILSIDRCYLPSHRKQEGFITPGNTEKIMMLSTQGRSRGDSWCYQTTTDVGIFLELTPFNCPMESLRVSLSGRALAKHAEGPGFDPWHHKEYYQDRQYYPQPPYSFSSSSRRPTGAFI
jgi:hypothetical protein